MTRQGGRFDHVVLIGMPASGKSTLGLLLAKSACLDFIDTDLLLQQKEQATLQHLIDRQGLSWFIEHEAAAITSINPAMPRAVIATGGSAVLSEGTMKFLRTMGQVIYIDVPLDRIQQRMHNIHTRGIAMRPDEKLEDVYLLREPLYRRYADIILEAGHDDIETLVERLAALLGLSECEH